MVLAPIISSLNTLVFKSNSYCVNEIKTGSKLKTSGRRFWSALLQLSSFRLSFSLYQRVEREGLPLASNLHFLLPGSSLGSCLTETDQQIDQHSNQACSEWVLSLFPRQLSASESELTSLFISSSEHGSKVSIVQKQTTSQRSQNEVVRFSWNCNLASQRILFAKQWLFLKDPRDHARDRKQRRLHLAPVFEWTFQRLIARASSYFFSQLFCLI